MRFENGPRESARPCCFPVLKVFFSRPQRSSLSTPCTSLPKPALSYQNLIYIYRIQTQRLTPAEDDMWTENRPRESARPCNFPVLKGFFSRSQRSSMSTTSTSLPKPALSYQNLIVFLVESDATFDIGGGWNAVRKWTSWVGQTMLFPRSEGFFFKAPEVFLVYNFHKPAKTSIIVPKPYIYIGFRRNVWHRRRMTCGLKIVLVSRPGHAVSLFWRVFFQGPRGLPCPQLPQACQNQHYRTKTL